MGQAVTSHDMQAPGPLEPERALKWLAAVVDGDHDPHLGLADGAARLQYVSPEQILGRSQGPRSDVYVLSAVLYRRLTGEVPFPRGRGRAVLFWHLHGPRPRPTAVNPRLPAAIDDVIGRGMAADPARRPATPAALVEEARTAFEERPAAPRLPVRPAPPAEIPAGTRRRPVIALGVVAALATAAGAAGFFAGTRGDDGPRSSRASVGSIELTVPPHWRRSTERATVGSVAVNTALVLTPPGSTEERLFVGAASPARSVAILTRLRWSPPAGELVSLQRTQARRYRAETVLDATTLYLAPTDRGVAIVACVADSPRASFMRRCEPMAAFLDLVRGKFTPVGPTPRQARRQARVFRRLNAARSAYGARIRRSRSSGNLAGAARALAGAHAREAAVLRSLGFTGLARPGRRTAVAGLERAAAAYRSLAGAARAGDVARYATSRRAVLAADRQIRRGLRMLRVVGYA